MTTFSELRESGCQPLSEPKAPCGRSSTVRVTAAGACCEPFFVLCLSSVVHRRSSLLTFHQTCFFASKDDGNVAQTGALRPERTATDAMQTIHAPNESVRFRLA